MNTENMTEFCLTMGEGVNTMLIEDSKVHRLQYDYTNALLGHKQYLSFTACDLEGQKANFIIPKKLLRESTLVVRVKS